MSQHDLSIANQGFPAFRSDLNDALQALGSMQSGATAPSTTYANMVWYDTANNVIKVRNEDNDAWITMLGFDQTTDILNKVGIFSFPTADGSANQVLTTNGSGTLSFTTLASDKITEGNSSVEVVDTGNGYITFTIDGSEAARIDNNKNFGLGTASPNYDLHIEKSKPSANLDFLAKNTGTDGTSNTRLMAAVSGASGGDPKLGVVVTGERDYFLYIDNSDSDKLKIESNGTDLLALETTGLLSLPYGQIKFPATQNASSDANTLDDYEEGSFTPSITINNSTSGITYSVQVGRYTKVGKLVQCAGYVQLTSKGGLSGVVRFAGLPFSTENTTNYYPAFMFSTWGGLASSGISIIACDLGSNATSATMVYGNATANMTALDGSLIANTFGFEFSMTYMANA